MTPIDRVSIKSQALAVLGLNNTTASADDIRTAYRARVREKHPDRCDGDSEAFLKVTDAFNFLNGEADTFDPTTSRNNTSVNTEPRPVSRTPRPSMDFTPKPRTRSQTLSRPVSKPSVQATETAFPPEVLKMCKNVLGEESGFLATHQKRAGRKLAYSVPVRLLNNVNRVALPTGDLFDKRQIKPIVLTIAATDIHGGSYIVPEENLAENFPGARRVEIRFIADI